MTLSEALKLVQHQQPRTRRRSLFLVCGFQPLHLATFLQAHFASRFPDESADLQTGLYGDVERTLASAAESAAEAATVVIEWADLDPRLGLRSTGNWALSVQTDIIENCRERFVRMLAGLERLAARMPVALVPPTLPVTLLGHTAGWQWSVNEMELQSQSATFLAKAGRIAGVAVLNPSSLARVSAEPKRLDAAMELSAGFPYTIEHASAIASQVVKLLFPPSPKKGLITDLDETLWSGIVGEVGASGVSWSLAEHAQLHGLFQQMLRHLSEMGVLLAVASKNESAVVEEALRREDLLVPAKSFFPVLANWGAKSESVAEILRVWNIGADSVVFIDDSAMELEEVQTAWPAMTCLPFPTRKPAKMIELLQQIRDLFGKTAIHDEDALRQSSIRVNAAIQEAGYTKVGFLPSLQGQITFDYRKDPLNKRLLELTNKTNQFNLNGIRLSEGEWMRQLANPASVVLGISYEDKFGPLGVIGVVAGKHAGRAFEVSTWVMSCRAFSRRIEFQTLQHLFESQGVDSISLCFQPTERNEPLQQFLRQVSVAADKAEKRTVSKEAFFYARHELPHRVTVREETPRREDGQDAPSVSGASEIST